jgi:hypothetical protein
MGIGSARAVVAVKAAAYRERAKVRNAREGLLVRILAEWSFVCSGW